MATVLDHDHETPVPVDRPDEFTVVASEHSLGYNLPQKAGRALWLPMFVMSAMAFATGLVLGIVRANLITDGNPADVDTIESLRHVTAGFVFLGLAFGFGAISFAIARILGAFRKGGGEVQESVGEGVQTLEMPATAKAFLAFMMMGMMAIVGAVIAHFVVAGTVVSAAPADLTDSQQWFTVLEGIRRIGVALYLFGILLGLATIITVLRFQSIRIREVAEAT